LARKIAIVSGKGGVGKTTSAINLAHALSKNRKTLLIDANLSTPNIHTYLGWPILKNTLVSVLKNESSLKDSIYTHESGLRILPSISTLSDLKKLKMERMHEVMTDLEDDSQLILLDSAAGIGREAYNALYASDEVLIVTNPELGAVLDAQKTIQLAHEVGRLVLGVVLNKVRGDKHELSVRDVEKLLDIPVIGVIPFDNSIRKSLSKKHPVTHAFPKSKASKKYEELASLIIGPSYVRNQGRKKTMKEYVLEKLGFN
jgi:cell division ATPase MinD